MDPIDWGPLHRYPPMRIECACGAVYRSHHKIVPTADQRMTIMTELPCPTCGSTVGHVLAARGDFEHYTIGPDDVRRGC